MNCSLLNKYNKLDLKSFLEEKYEKYNHPSFIELDPISIPHLFSQKQDIEIMGFLSATLAWGQRATIINKCKELIKLMDGAPYDFILNHEENDLKRLLDFKHRTFNSTDMLYFIHFFKTYYKIYHSLEDAFLIEANQNTATIEQGLNNFQKAFIGLPEFPNRTRKHISSPDSKSACKRLNMFLRWMVRSDDKGVDFGIWKKLKPSQLICPCDVHVDRIARRLGLIKRKQTDWLTAVELTERLKEFDPHDPV
ncbi:MAG TPA: TIGR02757 family protein, partial [Cytophagales bacterium]|nr:TIGR02757 family protein [Cytophagales bacterium]